MSDETIEKTKGFFCRLYQNLMAFVSGEMLQQLFGRFRYFVTFTVIIALAYVMMGYVCNKQRAEIAQLEKDLKTAYYRNMTMETEMTKVSRQSRLQEELIKAHSRIMESSVPAIKL